MLNASWATLLRQLPPEQHNSLMMRTSNGTEITVQDLLRIDPECVFFRGRLAGTQDAGRLFIMPYHNIDYFAINRMLKDEEFHAIFDTITLPDPGVEAIAPPPPPAPPLPEEPEELAVPPIAAIATPSRKVPPVKSSILERFRTRNTSPSGTGFRSIDE